MITRTQLDSAIGSAVHDSSGGEIGAVGHVFYDADTDEPTWITVKSGPSENLVPLVGAELDQDRISVAFDKAVVAGAPHLRSESQLDPDEERGLRAYYDLDSEETAGANPDPNPSEDEPG